MPMVISSWLSHYRGKGEPFYARLALPSEG